MSKNNEAAFPIMPPVDQTGQVAAGYPIPEHGMGLRDYLAAKAMQGFCANPDNAAADGPDYYRLVAGEAYQMADAMLAAREED